MRLFLEKINYKNFLTKVYNQSQFVKKKHLIMNNKKIIVLMTSDVRICDAIKLNLLHLGYKVDLIINDTFKYKSLNDKITNFYKKIFLKDKSYKRELVRKYEVEKNLSFLNSIDYNIDYALTIRPDKFDNKVLEKIKQISEYSVAYQWDGMNRFPEAKKTIPFFDRFFVFDKEDIINSDLSFTTNFYFDCFEQLMQTTPVYDVYFIGSYDNKIYDLINICEVLEKKGLKLNIFLATSKKRHLRKFKYIKFLKKSVTYIENLELLAQSRIIIDLAHKDIHNGLSFRIFESIGYEKKLITTNKMVKDFDFYNEDNIFLLDNNYDKLHDFINCKYHKIDEKIKQKYSFSNWINFMLDIKPFVEIK